MVNPLAGPANPPEELGGDYVQVAHSHCVDVVTHSRVLANLDREDRLDRVGSWPMGAAWPLDGLW